MLKNKKNWIEVLNQKEFESKSVEMIVKLADEAISLKGKFSIVLAGGNTPQKVYELLSKQNCDWNNWHIFFGDERCLPQEHLERNSYMAKNSFLSKVTIPESQIHIIPAELGNNQGAKIYNKKLNPNEAFDLVILGLGEDGHTASIFPNSEFDKEEQVVAISNAPKPPKERISLTPNRLSNSKSVIFLVSGKDKKIPLSKLRESDEIPATKISALENLSILFCNIN